MLWYMLWSHAHTIMQHRFLLTCMMIMLICFYTAVDCGEPPIVANGTIRHKITDTTFNAIARYRCDYSFIMAAGNLKIQCLENGDWEMAPQCEFTNTTMSREEYDRLWFTTEVTIGDGTENEHTTKEGKAP